MEEGSRRTKDRRFIVGLRDRVVNRILLLYVNIESKSSTFGMKENLGEEKGSFCCYLYPMVGWLSLDQDLLGLRL